jgi:molecular chaperone DnaK
MISLPETEDSEEESIIQVEPTSYAPDTAPEQQATPTPEQRATPAPAQRATPAPAQQASPTPSIAEQPSVGGKDPVINLLSAPELAGETVVAIDFGTTRSSVAVMEEGEVNVLRLPGGDWDIPSVVGFRKNGSVMVGSSARRMLATDPANAIASPKRLVGRRYEDRGLQPYLTQQAITSLAGPNGEVMLFARGREISATEACAHLLNLLRLISSKHIGTEVKEVLLTTPVSFGQPQFKGLTESAELAGLKVLQFVDEPVAAALANRAHPAFGGRVAVYDFGGGTFDFTVVEVSDDVQKMQVLTTAGDAWVGGDDLDEALAKAAANAFWQQHGIELRHQVVQWQRLLVVAEMAKRELSTATETTLRLPKAARTPQGELDLVHPVTRAEFSALIKEPIQRTLETCREAMALCDLKPKDLSAVFLSSGTCYIPAVQEAVADFFGKEPVAVVPPERAVLLGAAVYGGILAVS